MVSMAISKIRVATDNKIEVQSLAFKVTRQDKKNSEKFSIRYVTHPIIVINFNFK